MDRHRILSAVTILVASLAVPVWAQEEVSDDTRISECTSVVHEQVKSAGIARSDSAIRKACIRTAGHSDDAFKHLKGAKGREGESKGAKKASTGGSLTARLKPCRAGTWKLSRARALNPVTDKALINSKILEACVNTDFSPEATLKTVSGTYFAVNQRARNRQGDTSVLDTVQKRSGNVDVTDRQASRCREQVSAVMNQKGVVHSLDRAAIQTRISAACTDAENVPEDAFKGVLRALK